MSPLLTNVDAVARFKLDLKKDWITDPQTVLRFGDCFIGQEGGLNLKVLSAGTNEGDLENLSISKHGSALALRVLVNKSGQRLGEECFQLPHRELNVIGSEGLNSVLLRSFMQKTEGV